MLAYNINARSLVLPITGDSAHINGAGLGQAARLYRMTDRFYINIEIEEGGELDSSDDLSSRAPRLRVEASYPRTQVMREKGFAASESHDSSPPADSTLSSNIWSAHPVIPNKSMNDVEIPACIFLGVMAPKKKMRKHGYR